MPLIPGRVAGMLSLCVAACSPPSVSAVVPKDAGPSTTRVPADADSVGPRDAAFTFDPTDATFPPPMTGGCQSGPADDNDHDGYTVGQGDCNDCDKLVNPGAYDVAGNMVDEDCSGMPDDEPVNCDSGLALDGDAVAGAKALGICRKALPDVQGKGRGWGLLRAAYVFPDGTTAAIARGDNSCGKTGDPPNPLSHGILTAFGRRLKPRAGGAMLALSSGIARAGDTTVGKIGPSPADAEMCTRTRMPPGFPVSSYSTCGDLEKIPGITKDANDAIALELVIRVPTNASSLSFDFNFHTFEYKEFVCSDFNDAFVALLYSKAPDLPASKNIAFDSQQNPVSVNNGFVEVCEAWRYEGTQGGTPFVRDFPCGLGIADLADTGFEEHAATGWLQTHSNVVPGEELTLRFAIWDAGDEALDSTVLVDNFKWDAKPGTTVTMRPPDIK
jgi:hypothetical protein